jgi:hypothetical protein
VPKLVLAIVLMAAGCHRRSETSKPAGASAPAAASTALAPRAAPTSAAPEPGASTGSSGTVLAPANACRAIAVKGHVTVGGAVLTTGAPLDRSAWLELDPGASVAVKHSETSRELIFTGKGRVLPCERGEERFLLVEGKAETATWAGARPGAEVLVATPFGAVRYGDAKLVIGVDAHGLSVASETGDAWLFASGTEEKVASGKRAERRGPTPDVKSLVGECEKRAAEAEKRARAVLVPGPGAAPLGTRAAEHVRARKAARASCAVASAAIGMLALAGRTGGAGQAGQTGQAERSDDLGRRVAYADAQWRSVPPQVDPSPKVESR